MIVQVFQLINENGQQYSLMDKRKYALLESPDGLGYSYNTEYERVGNDFISNVRKLEQGKISGTLKFNNYENYRNLVDFIENSIQLKFSYKMPNTDRTYYKDIKIESLSKTQKNGNEILEESVEFNCLSLWYEEKETIFKVETYEDEMRYPYRWNSRYIDYNNRSIVFENKGHIDAPVQVEIDGFVKNPSISIFVDKELFASITIPITINEYEKLLYSSKTGQIYIQKQNTDGTKESLWKKQYIDITKQNIFKLPLGVSEIRLTADDEVLNAKLKIFPQYKVV